MAFDGIFSAFYFKFAIENAYCGDVSEIVSLSPDSSSFFK